MLVGANVSWDVASHTRHRPCSQGMMEIPSGRLLSPLHRPRGSIAQGMYVYCRQGTFDDVTQVGVTRQLPFALTAA